MSSFLYTIVFIFFYSCFGDKNRDLVPKEAPSNVTLVDIHGQHLQLEWEPVKPASVRGTFKGYLVRIWNHVGSQVYAIPPDVTKASIEYFPYSRNFVTVSVRNNKFVGPPSEPVSFDAPQGAPNYPHLFEGHQLGANSVLLQWNMPTHPNGILLGYNVYCTEFNSTYLDNEVTKKYFVQDPHKFQAKITGLRLGVKYKIGIAAVNCVGESQTNYLDFELVPHMESTPSVPDFKYRIDYEEIDIAEECSKVKFVDNEKEYEEDDDFFLTTDNKYKDQGPKRTFKETNNCIVITRITWIPDIDNNPGDHFYVRYRLAGDDNFTMIGPEVVEDYVLIEDFDACRNYEIIVTSVDGNFTTDSEVVVTPSVSYVF